MIVSVNVPVGVEAEVVTLSVEEPEPPIELGLNVPVALLGSPVTLRFTVPANPLSGLTLGV